MSYDDLLRCGVSRSRARTMVRDSSWSILRRGVYAEAGPLSVHLALAAADVACSGGWVASHDTAALLHGLVLLDPASSDRVVLTVPPVARSHADLPGVHFHRACLPAEHVTTAHGFPVTSVARTLIDLSRALPLRAGLVAVDGALHAERVTHDALEEVLADCRGWPWIRRAARVMEHADAAAESPLESVSRLFFVAHDIPTPRSQVTLLRDGLFIARTDFLWESQRVAGEADGLAKYTDSSVLRAEKLRQERIEATGVRVVRWTWQDIDRPAPARRTATRLRRVLGLAA